MEDPIRQIDHIGIAVTDMEVSKKLFSLMFAKQPFHEEVVETQNLKVAFFDLGHTKVELLESMSDKSAVHKFLEKRGQGIHHVAFLVDDIHKEMDRLRSEGFELLSEKPFRGALNKLVVFLHPKSANGVLVELCQKME